MSNPTDDPRDTLDRLASLGSASDERSDLRGGVLIGNFQLQVKLGRGGMGEVWKAWDTKAERPVVLKLVPPELQHAGEEMARIKVSFQRIHALQHQHICPVYLLDEDRRFGWYLVMKYIDGQTLSAYRATYVARQGEFPVEQVVKVLCPVAEALDYAHAQRVIHRDVKPQNILVVGDAEDVQIVDFGLAEEIRTIVSRVSQQQMDTAGTRPYMAPEQWKGQPQDARTDQYALAVVAYELISGRLPFESADLEILRLCVLNDPPEAIEGQTSALNRVLILGLAKLRQERFGSCREFVRSLAASCATGQSATPGPDRRTVQTPVVVPGTRPTREKEIAVGSGGGVKLEMVPLPSYVAAAQPFPKDKRVPWFKTTAQTYAGIMLWFVFWESVPTAASTPGGILAQGIGTAILGVVIAALICHFLFFVAPGMSGMKTGLPLAVVGTSTYGVQGGFLMPGFFMGVLQFGWLAVNAYFSSKVVAIFFDFPEKSNMHLVIGTVWAIVAAFVGLKGVHYIAKVATYLPLIPLVILLVLLGKTVSGVGAFKPEMVSADETVPGSMELMLVAIAGIVGFFATAGAAGADIASSNRDGKDVQLGGLTGIAGATIFTGCVALLIVAGAYGAGLASGNPVVLKPTELMNSIMGERTGKIFGLLLAIAAFPPACFSSLIAAASFKNTLPKVNPFISCGIGTAASIALVLSCKAGNAQGVFLIIGASFGPICGAMTADYLLAGCKWPGPRAGFNIPGWISWALGFVVGAWNSLFASLLHVDFQMPCPPVAAYIVGFVLYIILAKLGLESQRLEHPTVKAQ